jgi:hypothetical protein
VGGIDNRRFDRPMKVLSRLYELGCPTYRCNDGSRSRDGCSMCVFCEANLSCDERHAETCEWLEIERLVKEPGV